MVCPGILVHTQADPGDPMATEHFSRILSCPPVGKGFCPYRVRSLLWRTVHFVCVDLHPFSSFFIIIPQLALMLTAFDTVS
jgi:hypothetical protein